MSDGVTRNQRMPFDLYDFFGYLFPGAFFAAGVLFTLRANAPCELDFDELLTQFHAMFGGFKVFESFLALGAVLVVVYLLGHFVASFGSLIVEKYWVKGVLGYPYTHFLGLRQQTKRRFSEAVYKVMFILANTAIFFGIRAMSDESQFGWFRGLAVAFTVLFIGRVFFVMWTLLREAPDGTVTSKDPCEYGFFRKTVSTVFDWVERNCIDMPAKLLFRTTGILTRFDRPFIDSFDQKFSRDFHLELESSGTNVFWLCYTYCLKNAPESVRTIQNFYHMYSFARNMSISCLLLIFLQFLLAFAFNIEPISENVGILYWYEIILFIVGLSMLLRCIYIYSSYYTKFLFRVYLVAGDGYDPPTSDETESAAKDDSAQADQHTPDEAGGEEN